MYLAFNYDYFNIQINIMIGMNILPKKKQSVRKPNPGRGKTTGIDMNKQKIFCIGANKTGTTSLYHTFKHLGFINGGNIDGVPLLMEPYYHDNFKPIIEFCKSADVFQDLPFSIPKTYEILEKEFPDAKFILSIRESSEHWYNSLVKFHDKQFFRGKKVTPDLMKKVNYVRPQFLYKFFKQIFKTPDDDLYNKKILIDFYENHNRNIINYFKDKPNKLLIITLSNTEDFNKLLNFLDITDTRGLTKFYHSNKT